MQRHVQRHVEILGWDKMPKIDPWGSAEITDYEHAFSEFGLEKFPEAWRAKLKHRLFERGIVVAHRGFETVMKRITAKKPFINMTGIASSGHLHLGHKVDIDLFVFFKSLGARNYFAVCDIDAYVSRPDSAMPSLAKAKEFAAENLAHALALGISGRDAYVQSRKERRYYEFAFELSKRITRNMFEAVYGHIDLGKVSANLLQYADILHPQLQEHEGRMPSVTGIGLEQDPHAKVARDIARRLPYGLEMPSFIYFTFQSGLKEGKKMSSSEPDTAIFLTDSAAEADRKIQTAFTGGRNTEGEQRRLGGNPDICKVHELLRYHHPNTKEVVRLYDGCRAGTWLCKECKRFTSDFICGFLKGHQKKVLQKAKTAKKIVFGK